MSKQADKEKSKQVALHKHSRNQATGEAVYGNNYRYSSILTHYVTGKVSEVMRNGSAHLNEARIGLT